jgi:hypothetical protein
MTDQSAAPRTPAGDTDPSLPVLVIRRHGRFGKKDPIAEAYLNHRSTVTVDGTEIDLTRVRVELR